MAGKAHGYPPALRAEIDAAIFRPDRKRAIIERGDRAI
jgi:hypothetical protein